MGRASMWKGWPRIVAVTLLLISALPWMLANERRPLIGADSVLRLDRAEILFIDRPGRRTAYEELVELGVREGARHVCLVANTRDWEYPLWVMIRERLGADATLHHFGVRNISSRLADRDGSCDYVMRTRVRADP